MSKFNIGDNVFYIPENEPGKIIAVLEDMPFDSEYVFESDDKKHCCRVTESKLRELVNPADEFEKLSEEAKQKALMQTMQRCQEVFDSLQMQHKLSGEKLGDIDWYTESDYKIELCKEYEMTYCGTPEYDDDYGNSTTRFFTEKLLKLFGAKEQSDKLYRCSMSETYTFYIRSDSDIATRDYLEKHTIADIKNAVREHTGYTREVKEDILSVTDFNPNSSYGFEMIDLGGMK